MRANRRRAGVMGGGSRTASFVTRTDRPQRAATKRAPSRWAHQTRISGSAEEARVGARGGLGVQAPAGGVGDGADSRRRDPGGQPEG